MNIDLLVSQKNEAGLLCSQNLIAKAIGAILDTNNGLLSLEFEQMNPMDMNIPIEPDFFKLLDSTPFLHVGSVKDGKIGQAYQIPLMILNDPYRSQLLQHTKMPGKPLEAFHYFVRSCVLGQPIHRDDMGDEETSGCILGDAVPSSLQFAPQLAKRHGLEMQNIPAPSLLPGMGLGGSTTTRTSGTYRSSRSSSQESDDE